MTQNIIDEALEHLQLNVKFGFEDEDELFDIVSDVFSAEDEFDEEWLKSTIAKYYNQHQQESLSWVHPTDFDRLAKAFDELTAERIVCLHNAGYTKQDAISDCNEAIYELNNLGINVIGYCYYHAQDLARAVDPDARHLCLGFDSSTQDDNEALQVAHKIVATLTANNFEVNWPGTIEQRIQINNINWQKIPDNQNWGLERIIAILKKATKSKPFWKIW